MSGEYILKIVVVGDLAVGKTSLVVRYAENKFPTSYKPTIGADIMVKMVDLKGKKVRLAIWDIAGHETFQKIRRYYYQGAAGALILYDVTNPESFEHVKDWYDDVVSHCGKIPVVLIGNKIDLKDQRKVTTEQGVKKAEEMRLSKFLETSAKTGANVHSAFVSIIEEALKIT
ncbi:MAG: GTP-binding protein [Candidatus Baldrarchaeia archaeon]